MNSYLLKPVITEVILLVVSLLSTQLPMPLVALEAANALMAFINQTEWVMITIIGLVIIAVIWLVISLSRRRQMAENRGYLILYNHEFTINPKGKLAYGEVFELANQTKRRHTWKPPGTSPISRIVIEQSTQEASAEPLRARIDAYLAPNDFHLIKKRLIKEGQNIPVREYHAALLNELGQRGWEWTKDIEIDPPLLPPPLPPPPLPPLPPPPPKEICGGKYKILDHQLGEGGYGKVYLVEHKYLKEQRAAKRLFKSDGSARERFKREGNILSKYPHSNIVVFYDFDVCVDQLRGEEEDYIIMEYAPHGSLKDLMKKRANRLLIEDVIKIGKQLSSALVHIHQNGIIHRDIKPGNVLVFDNENITVKLSDFGIARLLYEEGLTGSGLAPWTALYAAPEQVERGESSFQSDIYSLGATLYHLVTGEEKPLSEYLKSNYHELISPSNLRNDIPHWLESIIMKSLRKEKERGKRYQSAQELLDALSAGDTDSNTNPTAETED